MADIALKHGQHPVEAFCRIFAGNQTGGGDGPGVDHRVVGTFGVFIQTNQRIERIAGRLNPDFLDQVLAPVVFEDHAVHKDFGDGLYGELLLHSSDIKAATVEGDHADAEPVRVSFG